MKTEIHGCRVKKTVNGFLTAQWIASYESRWLWGEFGS